MRTIRVWTTALLLLGQGRVVAAQDNEQGSPRGAIVGGVVGGAAGFLAGGLTGASAAGDCGSEYDDFCRLAGAFVGAAMGGTFGMALGVHLGNHRRGNFALDLLTGAAVWVTGISIAAAGHWDNTLTSTMFVAIPSGQLATTVAVERALGRSRARGGKRRVTMYVVPRSDGRATLLASVAF